MTFPVTFCKKLASKGSLKQIMCLYHLAFQVEGVYFQWKTGTFHESLLHGHVSYSPLGFAGLRDGFFQAIIIHSIIYQS